MTPQCFSLRRLQLGLSSLLILVEVLGIGLWIWAPHRLLPWPVGRWEVIHYGHCKAVNASVFVNVSLHVNPLAHCFSGTISRMINSYISYNGMPVFNFAEHCSEQTKPLSSGQTIDYDDPTQALILENTIHHTTEAEDFVRIKRGHPLNASQSFLRTGISKSYNTATRPEKQGIEFNGDMFAECVLLAIAVCVNLALLVATIKRIPLLFMPWMLFYGFEVLAGWAITLAFLVLPGWFRLTSVVGLFRSSFLTYSWICIVRRHQHALSTAPRASGDQQRPKLQTIISIATAHPFAPRPTTEMEMNVMPSQQIIPDIEVDISSPVSLRSFHF